MRRDNSIRRPGRYWGHPIVVQHEVKGQRYCRGCELIYTCIYDGAIQVLGPLSGDQIYISCDRIHIATLFFYCRKESAWNTHQYMNVQNLSNPQRGLQLVGLSCSKLCFLFFFIILSSIVVHGRVYKCRSYGACTPFLRRKESFKNTRARIQTPFLRRRESFRNTRARIQTPFYGACTPFLRRKYGVHTA